MKPIVLDTDVVSFLFKNDSRAQLYLPYLVNRQWLISFMTEAELEQWSLLANWSGARRKWLRMFLARFIIVPSSHDLVIEWAEGWSPPAAPAAACKLPTRGSRRQLFSTAHLC